MCILDIIKHKEDKNCALFIFRARLQRHSHFQTQQKNKARLGLFTMCEENKHSYFLNVNMIIVLLTIEGDSDNIFA